MSSMEPRGCAYCGEMFTPQTKHRYRNPRFCSRVCSNRGTAHPHDVVRRFWSKVDQGSDCWLWQAATAGSPGWKYGYFWFGERLRRAHVVSWILANGEIEDGTWVLHRCDTPLCVRPEHLFLGDLDANVQDMTKKERGWWQRLNATSPSTAPM
jgi:hypothetical protein